MLNKRVTTTSFVTSLNDMPPQELEEKIQKMRAEIFVEMVEVKRYGTGYSRKGSGKIRVMKRHLARALTIQSSRRTKGG